MISLSVLFEPGVSEEAAAAALRAAGLGDPRWEAVEQEGLAGHLAWLPFDGSTVGVLLVASPASPPGLRDALLHAAWPDAEPALRRHAAHARLFVPDEEASALARLVAATRCAEALLALPGAIALLADDGRALTEAAAARRRTPTLRGPTPPLDLWIAIRRFGVADAAGATFLDTLGMAQLGLPDLESYAGPGTHGDRVADWLRNLSLYLVQQGTPFRSGDTLDGPDELPWVATEDEATVEPPRRVLRFAPLNRDLDE